MEAKRDENYVTSLLAVSNVDGETPVAIQADPTTKRLLVDVSGGMGTSEVDNSAFTVDTDAGSPIMGIVSSSAVSAGNVGVVQMTAARLLRVDIATDSAGIGGGTEYQEDTAHSSGATGKLALAVRNDAGGSLSDTDGDYSVLQVNAQGELYTVEKNSTAILADTANIDTSTATIAGAVSGTEMTVGGSVASNAPDGGNPVKVGGVYNSTPPTLDDGDRGDLQLGMRGSLRVEIWGKNGERGADMSADNVDGEAVTGTANALKVANRNYVFNNTTWDRMRGNTGGLFAQGGVAHDAADSGNPIKIGAKAAVGVKNIPQVANSDRTHLYSDLNGILITRPHCTLEEILVEAVSNTDGAETALTTFGAGGSGIHNYVTTITVYNSSATDGYIELVDGSGGSTFYYIPLPTLGGSVIPLPVPLKQPTANTALYFDVSGALSTVYISVVGFQAQG